jgi:hypothetical protein
MLAAIKYFHTLSALFWDSETQWNRSPLSYAT